MWTDPERASLQEAHQLSLHANGGGRVVTEFKAFGVRFLYLLAYWVFFLVAGLVALIVSPILLPYVAWLWRHNLPGGR